MDIAIFAFIRSASPHKQYTYDKIKLQATAIINDCYKYIMDLTTNGVVVTDAIKYVTQVDVLQKLDKRIQHRLLGLSYTSM
jgi:hypothetical protein